MHWTKNVVAWGLVSLLGASAACSCGGNGGGTPNPGNTDAGTTNPGTVESNVMKGRAVDSQGKGLAGVEITAHNQFQTGTTVKTMTGADGAYRLDVSNPTGPWLGNATLETTYHGAPYRFTLVPDDSATFAGNVGALRNFTWKLTGAKPDGGNNGGIVTVYFENFTDPDNPGSIVNDSDVELTLTPDGPLVDGSAGTTITAKAEQTTEGYGLPDVAVGRYTIKARYTPQGQTPRPLLIRVRNTGSYNPTVTTDFFPLASTAHIIELNVQFP
ncbi:carboxypeptidase-like regulatory domain-containing protein [Corallococcus llansteffanensis]|uniref:Carboxypeptidase regulatory-like domain-containing protein n=1 Tax=Corallococcus llansteffanensis TaxID=2316731 RepID=A0A3A8NI18_9BACT|nr:carboxypeptidase-like regulatory domain-containing protein [Corallococcus llansteffanensis]RKH43199.1 carboxypeptidase regulatory-like domain-containing protein [Corallococcus llansteffanensis]